MPDVFKEVSHQGYGSRVMGSFGGILIGIILFFASFIVLYWNEGRVDISQIAKKSVEVQSSKVDASLDQKLISVTGPITSSEKLSDKLFLNESDYIAIYRKSEMYAWTEKTDTDTTTQTGGSQTTETTYTYDTAWTSSPEKSSSFKHPEGHQNPNQSITSETFKVNNSNLEEYKLDMANLKLDTSLLVSAKKLQLDSENTTLTEANKIVENYYVYQGAGNISNPQVGDQKISYYVLPQKEIITVFGKLDSGKITTFTDEKDNTLFRIFLGDRATAISTMKTEYTVMTWILRLVGFLMMWIGLSAMFGPISVVLDFLPFLGSASRGIIGFITFIVALALSVLTILISMIIHNIVALIIILAIIVISAIIITAIFMKKKKGAKPASA
ncbi:MAG: TMEM43 family protein [Patescibacteria group bacterium]|jgi:hypothetical protein